MKTKMKNTTAIILVVLAIGLFFTFTNPQYQAVQGLSSELAEYRAVLKNAEAITEMKILLADRYDEVPEVEIERLSKVLPDTVDDIRLALDIDAIASRYGLSIKNVSVDGNNNDNSKVVIEPQTGLPYDKVEVSFSFISGYDNFKKFMSDIEDSLRITDIKSVSFKTSDAGIYDHQVSVETYWLK